MKRIVVIGGGIVGTAIAFELRTRGADVVLVDRDPAPRGTSAFSFASVSGFDEPLRDVYLLKAAGMVEWSRWSKLMGSDLGLMRGGEVRWAESPVAARKLESLLDRAVGRGYPVRSISRAEIVARFPGAALTEVLLGTYARDDAQVDAHRAISSLRGAFVDMGGEFIVGSAEILIGDPSPSVRIGEVEVSTSTLVLAAGPEIGNLLRGFGWSVPMESSPGMLVVTTPARTNLPGVVYISPTRGLDIHMRQLPDGRVLIGHRSQAEVARDPTTDHAIKLLRQAQRSFPALEEVAVDRFTVGWRPMPRDRMPIIGPLPGMPSIYIAAAHSGFTVGPTIAKLLAAEVLEGQSSERLEPFRPSRFSRHEAEMQASIEEAFS